jgi:hypothetical protein
MFTSTDVIHTITSGRDVEEVPGGRREILRIGKPLEAVGRFLGAAKRLLGVCMARRLLEKLQEGSWKPSGGLLEVVWRSLWITGGPYSHDISLIVQSTNGECSNEK